MGASWRSPSAVSARASTGRLSRTRSRGDADDFGELCRPTCATSVRRVSDWVGQGTLRVHRPVLPGYGVVRLPDEYPRSPALPRPPATSSREMARRTSDGHLVGQPGKGWTDVSTKILVPLDGSGLADIAVGYAAQVAKTLGWGVVLFSVVHSDTEHHLFEPSTPGRLNQVRTCGTAGQGSCKLKAGPCVTKWMPPWTAWCPRRHSSAPRNWMSTGSRCGKPQDLIVKRSAAHDIALIVMGKPRSYRGVCAPVPRQRGGWRGRPQPSAVRRYVPSATPSIASTWSTPIDCPPSRPRLFGRPSAPLRLEAAGDGLIGPCAATLAARDASLAGLARWAGCWAGGARSGSRGRARSRCSAGRPAARSWRAGG